MPPLPISKLRRITHRKHKDNITLGPGSLHWNQPHDVFAKEVISRGPDDGNSKFQNYNTRSIVDYRQSNSEDSDNYIRKSPAVENCKQKKRASECDEEEGTGIDSEDSVIDGEEEENDEESSHDEEESVSATLSEPGDSFNKGSGHPANYTLVEVDSRQGLEHQLELDTKTKGQLSSIQPLNPLERWTSIANTSRQVPQIHLPRQQAQQLRQAQAQQLRQAQAQQVQAQQAQAQQSRRISPEDKGAEQEATVGSSSIIVSLRNLTISDDQTTGSSHKGRILSVLQPKDTRLRLVGEKSSKLRAKSEYQIYDPPPLESLRAAPPTSSNQQFGQSGNHALQDYQMQLLLLEQQNKKRLMMARQEQHEEESNRLSSAAFQASAANRPSGTQTAGRTLLPPDDLKTSSSANQAQDQASGSENTQGNKNAQASSKIVPAIHHHNKNEDFEMLPDQDSRNQSSHGSETSSEMIVQTLESLFKTHLLTNPHSEVQSLYEYVLEIQEKATNYDEAQASLKPRRHETLYRLIKGKSIEIYLDHPVWVYGEKRKVLRSILPVANLSMYLQKHPDLAFVVYKDFDVYELESVPVQDEDEDEDQMLQASNTHENILPVSSDLRLAVDALLRSKGEFADLLAWYKQNTLIPAPYLAIYHSRMTMDKFLDSLRPQCGEQLLLLVDYVLTEYGEEYATVDNLLSRGRISIPFMKYLFKPNDVLVEKKEKNLLGYVSKSWPLITKSQRKPHAQVETQFSKHVAKASVRIWEIEAWSWHFDGAFYRENRRLNLKIEEEGEGEDDNDEHEYSIADLNVYPLEYAPAEVKDLLKRRGETFWSCRSRRFVSLHDNTRTDWHASSDERYMIDMKTYRELHTNSKKFGMTFRLDQSPEAELPAEEFEQESPPDGDFVFLLPLTITGFHLRRKKWVDLRADQISNVTWNKEAFKSLVMNRKTKDLIQALISNQLDAEKSTDLISGKGNGLILLLHGGPGTGKTLTAESVAEIAEKPLYRVTCGDIGTEPDEVETYLESVLNLGKIWGCVVLLDEADVFLEQRSLEDLLRNALVSVFLRVLEYYDGILVLTSNRVGTFDEAFKSRIQLALHYPNLGPFQRRQIWENFITRLENLGEKMIDFDDLKDHLEHLAEEKMNGRQIRNAFTTARQYAQWKNTVLTYEHLKDVIEISGRFDLYLDKLHGGYTQDQLAEDEGLRLVQAP